MSKDIHYKNQLGKSGYPFQSAVAEVIRLNSNWHVDGFEVPWINDDLSGFVDLVIKPTHKMGPVFVVECKKVQVDSLSSEWNQWIFSKSTFAQEDNYRFAITNRIHPTVNLYAESEQVGATDRFTIADTCIRNKKKFPQLIETLIREQIFASRALAVKDYHNVKEQLDKTGRAVVVKYIPILVTNAPLVFAKYDFDSVSLDSGEIEGDIETEEVNAVCFQKPVIPDLTEPQTAYIVRGNKLNWFLSNYR